MKLALVLAGCEEGGLEKHVLELANGLSAHGHEVSVVAHEKYRNRLAGAVRFYAVDLARGRRNLIALWLLWRALRVSSARLVHAHGNKAVYMVSLLLPWLHMASVATLHSKKRNVSMFSRFQRVIAVSHASTYNLRHHGARVVHNGVSLPSPLPDPAEVAWQGLSGGQRVLAVGRLVAVKGFDVLLSAWRNVNASLVIAGDGCERAHLERLIREYQLQDRVRLLGHRDDVLALMHAADLLAISSHYEGCPYTMVEALLMRKPIVSTAVGAMTELLPASALCTPASAASLAQALKQALADLPVLYAGFQPVFARAESTLTFDSLLSHTEAIYAEVYL